MNTQAPTLNRSRAIGTPSATDLPLYARNNYAVVSKQVLDVNGSIVECGVLHGGGLLTFAKLSAIFEPVNHTRRIIGFGVHRDPIDGPVVCRMFNEATAGHPVPRRVSTDHDPLFRAHRWQANLRVLGAEEIKTVPYVPMSHPFVERAIGTVRREYLDHTLFWNSLDLQRANSTGSQRLVLAIGPGLRTSGVP